MKGDSRSSTIKLAMPPQPCAEDDVAAQLLIKEARARARRRRRRVALVLTGLLLVTAGVVAVVRGPSGKATTARRDRGRSPAVAPAAVLPRFFADAQGSGEGNGPLQIRETATGKLVSQDEDYSGADYLTGLAAAGQGSFVVAQTDGNTCATRLYRVRLSSSGLPGALAPVGPTLAGQLSSLAVGGGGRVIGYAISACSKSATGYFPSYLGVLQVPSGRTRQWGMSLGVASSGDLWLQGQLSMSANGRLLAFAADASSRPDGRFTSQNVRVMATDAPPGSVAERSRIVYRQAESTEDARPSLWAASLSPSGKSVYLCLQSATRTHALAEIAAYDTTGKPAGIISTFTANGTWPQLSCSSMALDSSGSFLLVPYWVNHPTSPGNNVLQRLATINLATKAVSTVPVDLGGSGGMSEESGMSIVAW
jgi:hypothetical protein